MDRRGVGQRGAANILDMHLSANRNAEITHLTGAGQSTKPIRLHLRPLAGAALPCDKVILEIMKTFIQQDRLRHARGDMRA